MTTNWFHFAVIAGLSSSIFNFVNRIVLKTNGDSTTYAWWFEIFRLGIFLVILPFDHFFVPSLRTFTLLALLGITEFFSVYYYMKMHKHSEVSISMLILRLRIVWVPIFALIALGERLSYLEYVGILIVFLGLAFATSPKRIFLDQGVKYAILSSLITAILAILAKAASSVASPSIVTIAMGLPFIFLCPFLMINWKIRAKDFYDKNLALLLLTATAGAASMYFQVLALKFGSTSKVSAVFQALSFATILAGIFILKEKQDMWKKIIGGVVVLSGVLLLV